MKILIAGAGALGSNIAKHISADLKGKHEISIVDFDKVEKRNVQAGTQFYMPDQIGLYKVDALQFNIYKSLQRKVTIYPQKIQDLVTWDFDLIVDCFDNHEARKWLQDRYVFPLRADILHVGFSDQFTFAIEWADNYKVPDDITSGMDICEMEGASSFVNMVASLASLTAQEFINNKKKQEFLGNRFRITAL